MSESSTVDGTSVIQWTDNGGANPQSPQLVHPTSGDSHLKTIKEAFNITKGLFDLLKSSKELPFVLKKEILLSEAKQSLTKIGSLDSIVKIVKK